jgi:hypothetical protein
MRHKLRKKDRIAIAGKGCNKAQYRYGTAKKKWQGRGVGKKATANQ